MRTEGEIACSARNLTKDYPHGIRALAGVDCEVRRGTLTALVGANGSGKTTLLRILAGDLAATGGEVQVLGLHDPALAEEGALRSLRRRLSYLSQDLALDPEMTGEETLQLLAVLHGVPTARRRERTRERAVALGIAEHLTRRIGAYSGGQKRRLHLAAATLHDPELLLLDEPSAGLDAEGRQLLWTEIGQRTQSGRSVVCVTHDLEAVEREAQSVHMLEAGRIVASGSPAELTARLSGESVLIHLRRAPSNPTLAAEVVASLTRIDGVTNVHSQGRILTAELTKGARSTREELFATLSRLELELADLEFRRPDLAAVYRARTGREAPGAPRPDDGRGAGGRGSGRGGGRGGGRGARGCRGRSGEARGEQAQP